MSLNILFPGGFQKKHVAIVTEDENVVKTDG